MTIGYVEHNYCDCIHDLFLHNILKHKKPIQINDLGMSGKYRDKLRVLYGDKGKDIWHENSNKVQCETKAEDNNNMHNPIIKRCQEVLHTLLLLDYINLCLCFILHLVSHAIYHCLCLDTASLSL